MALVERLADSMLLLNSQPVALGSLEQVIEQLSPLKQRIGEVLAPSTPRKLLTCSSVLAVDTMNE